MRAIGLAIVLFAYWLALSGHYTPFLLAMGVLMALFCVYIASRMHTLDEEGLPLHLLAKGLFGFYIWLAWEIIKSSLTVTKVILDPRLPISPTMTKVKATQKTPIGVSFYANSITLTPGTVTVAVEDGDVLVVHALQRAAARDLESGVMDAHVTSFEDA